MASNGAPANRRTSRVCVHVPSYNQRAYLPEALDSVLSQSYRDFHIIIVDDASTDGSADIARDYGRQNPDRIECIVNETNLGIPRRLGVALGHCDSEFFAYLDGDDLWKPDALVSMVRVMDEQPDVGLVYGDAEWFDDRTGKRIALLSEIDAPAEGSIFHELLLRNNFVAPQAHLVRRRCLRETNVSLADPPFKVASDYYLWLSICSRFPAAYVPRVLGQYRRHDSNLSLGVVWKEEVRQVLQHVATRCPDAVEKICAQFAVMKAERDRYQAGLEAFMNKPVVRFLRRVKRMLGIGR